MTRTEERIHNLERFGSELTLDRVASLLRRLGNPEQDLKIVHVAGTNGKGSTCRYIYSMLRAAGYKVGLYTSPFLEVFNERIEYDGEIISDEDLDKYGDVVFEKIDEMVADGERAATEFEATTALGMLYYKEKHCDYVVMEVGLGGRGDATNVIKAPLVSVIGTIALDHTERLGDTIAKIAFEKAGIIKPGCPIVTAAKLQDARDVISCIAAERGCEYFETYKTDISIKSATLDGNIFDAEILGKKYENLTTTMPGLHQIDNAVLALTAVEILKKKHGIEVSEDAIREGLLTAKQTGRLEVMKRDPLVVIDGAHNPEGARAFTDAIKANCKGMKTLMVTGILADKDVDGVLDCFTEVAHDFIVTEPSNHRAMELTELTNKLKGRGCNVIATAKEPTDAAALAKQHYDEYDLVLFAGSLYMIGVIRSKVC